MTKPFIFSAIFLTALVIVTVFSPMILQTCFRKGKDFSSLPGGNPTLKTLVGGSTSEVKGVVGDQRISSCLAQLQKLDLPREAEGGEEEEEGAVAPFEYEIVTKTTTTGKKTHVIYVGDNKYLSRGIKKNGQAFFYCNFVSVHHKCTSSFRVRYHDLHNPMDEIPEVETQPSPHVTSDGVGHLPDKVKRLKENMTEKICEAIKVDPLRPIREIHEECLNNVLHGIDDAEERIEFCQQMPTYRQCERNERRFRNRLIPPNPPTARDIRSDGIFTLDPETGINTICFDDQGEADHDRIIALGHPEVQRYVKNVEYRF